MFDWSYKVCYEKQLQAQNFKTLIAHVFSLALN